MADILKHPSVNNKGMIVLNHKELGMNIHHALPNWVLENYHMGSHYGSVGGIVHTDRKFQSFCFSGPDMPKPNDAYIIPYDVRVVAEFYDKNEAIDKHWDVINVSRDIDVKNLDLFLQAIVDIHNKGRRITALLIIPKSVDCGEQIGALWDRLPANVQSSVDVLNCNRPSLKEAVNNHDSNIFTIVDEETYDKENGYLGLPRYLLAKFYQASKTFNISSYNEGQCRVLYEALCVGLPVTSYQAANHSQWILTRENSRLFTDQRTLSDGVLHCIENYNTMNMNYRDIQRQVREDYVLPLIKKEIENFYSSVGETFDGDLLHFDVSSKTDYPIYTRLCGHNWAPWGPSSDRTIPQADIKTEDQVQSFLKELIKE
jgi:glycosyltransferase involved in cell wall biosynthesis